MSTLKVNTIQNTSGVEVYTAKAWVNFNGNGTVAIRASGGVSSITDNATGQYTVNFTTAMPDADYAHKAQGSLTLANSNLNNNAKTHSPAVGSIAVRSGSVAQNSAVDYEEIRVAIFR